MRKTVIFLFAITMFIIMLTGCQKNTVESPASTVSEPGPIESPAATPLVQPTTAVEEEAPEPIEYTPADILGEKLNPFFGLEIPKSFELENVSIYTPGWDIEGDTMQYHMGLLGPMHNDTITAMAELFGVTSESAVNGFLDTFQKEGRVIIDGGGGRTCEISTSPKNDGWVVSLVSIIEKADNINYSQFMSDNFNMNIFGAVSKSLPLMPVTDKFKINVCYVPVEDMQKTELEIAYTVDDWAAVLESMKNGGGYSWYDSDSHMFGIDCGIMYGNIRFVDEQGHINVTQGYKGIPDSALREFVPDQGTGTTLETLGLQYNPENGSYGYRDEETETSISIYNDSWKIQPEDVNRNIIRYSQKMKGCLLFITFYPNKDRYEAQVFEGSKPTENAVQSFFAYNVNTNTVVDRISQGTDMKPEAFFAKVLNVAQTDAIFTNVIKIFDQYIMDTFGMTPEELFNTEAS